MAVVEIQVRTDRFCELIRGELNCRYLEAPTLKAIDGLPDLPGLAALNVLKGKLLESVHCSDCAFFASDGNGTVYFNGQLVIAYHENLDAVRTAGSFGTPSPLQTSVPFKLKLAMAVDPGTPQQHVLSYDLTLYEFSVEKGRFALELPDELETAGAAIEASNEVVAIRIGTRASDQLLDVPVSWVGQDEWAQFVPGGLVADTVRRVLDEALDEATKPSDSDKELRKDGPAWATWLTLAPPLVKGRGDVVALNACPLFGVNIDIEFHLTVRFTFPSADTMLTTAELAWDADTTLCDIVSLLLTIPGAFALHLVVSDGVDEAVLGKPLTPGGGFEEVGRTDDSVKFERVSSVGSTPAPTFLRDRADAFPTGFRYSGRIRPRGAPHLKGQVIPAMAKLAIDCNLRATSMVFEPAQVTLRNDAPGHAGRPPRLFLENTVFDPAGAWDIAFDKVDMSNPNSTAPQTVLTFVDPPAGRLPVGTATSVFLTTDCGVRWVDLGPVPQIPSAPPSWAERTMNQICDAIHNPWDRDITKLDWQSDPLGDPDYEHGFEIAPLKLWRLVLRALPEAAHVEFVAVNASGGQRLLGGVYGPCNEVLDLVTDADESLAIKPVRKFRAPPPTVTRSWLIPFKEHRVDSTLIGLASAAGTLALFRDDGSMEVLRANELSSERLAHSNRSARARGPAHLAEIFEREQSRGRPLWSTAVRLDRNTVAVVHRDRLFVATARPINRVQ